jgi:hypothetical protein
VQNGFAEVIAIVPFVTNEVLPDGVSVTFVTVLKSAHVGPNGVGVHEAKLTTRAPFPAAPAAPATARAATTVVMTSRAFM